jgi:predicted ester cyclase
MTEQDRDLGRRWFEQVWNEGRREAVVELLTPGCVLHEGSSDAVGPEGFYPFYDRLNAALSEVQATVDDTFAEGDKLCVRWSFSAKHTGEGLGIQPAGAAIHITGILLIRVADGKIAEAWQNWDMLGMLEQVRGEKKAATYVTA